MKRYLTIFQFLLFFPLALGAQIITTIPGTLGGIVYDPQFIAFDLHGNLYCASGSGNTVIKIDTFGIVSIFAGNGVQGYYGDNGLATLAKLHTPTGVTTDSLGNVYITDNGNNRVRKIDNAGIITTIAGNVLHPKIAIHFR